jgi:hypothetical protein
MPLPEPEACDCPRCGALAHCITIETAHGTTRVIGCACVPKSGTPQLVDDADVAWAKLTEEERDRLRDFADRRLRQA